MRKSHIEIIFIIIIGILPIITYYGCSTAHLSNMWIDPEFNNVPFSNILVIAVKKNGATRRIWEDGFVTLLKEYKVNVTPSYQMFPGELPDTNQLISTAKNKGYDGVIIAGRAFTQVHYDYVPGYINTRPIYLFNPWYQTYYGFYEREYNHGDVIATRVFRNQIDVWSIKEKEQIVWTGTGEEIDPNSNKDASYQITKVVVSELERQEIIPPAK